jgi:hypothetical protein
MKKNEILDTTKEKFLRLWDKKELTDDEWEMIESYRNIFFCSTPVWGLFECTGEIVIEFVQYQICSVCHQWRNPVLFMSNAIALRERMDTPLVCRICYPDVIGHKKAPVDPRIDAEIILKQFRRDNEIVAKFQAHLLQSNH